MAKIKVERARNALVARCFRAENVGVWGRLSFETAKGREGVAVGVNAALKF